MAGESHLAIKAVALDAMGVIYSVADDLRDLLIPYLRRKGCTLPDGEIVARYRACYREGRPAETIWQDTGCAWQDGALERDFLGSYQLNQGAAEFLDAMQCAGITLFGLSNDVAEWAVARRHLFGLDSYFEGWVVSGEVKAYKPSPLIYERLLSMLPCSPSECLFVDDRIENLEAATPFGLRTVRFSLNGSDGFDTVADFAELTSYVHARAP